MRVRLPLGALRNRSETWDAIATSEWSIRGRWPLANLVRQPRISPSSLRWGPCWYGRTAVNRLVAGSIPATAAGYQSRHIAVDWLLRAPNTETRKHGNTETRELEVIRPDEGPVSKTGAGAPRCGFESHGFRFRNTPQSTRLHRRKNNMCLWPSGKGAGLPTRSGGFDSRGALCNTQITLGVQTQAHSECEFTRAGADRDNATLRGSFCW